MGGVGTGGAGGEARSADTGNEINHAEYGAYENRMVRSWSLTCLPQAGNLNFEFYQK